MTRLAVSGLAALIATLTAAWPAAAQPPCGPHEQVLDWLAERYDEAPLAVGVGNNARLVELVVSPGGETWSLLIVRQDGIACLVAAGEAWRPLGPAPAGPES